MNIQMKRTSDQVVVGTQIKIARDFFTRFRGLLGHSNLTDFDGMLFPRCQSVHMWGMRMDLDILFLKQTGNAWTILEQYEQVKAWRFLPVTCWKADDTLELPSGSIAKLNLRKGDQLCSA